MKVTSVAILSAMLLIVLLTPIVPVAAQSEDPRILFVEQYATVKWRIQMSGLPLAQKNVLLQMWTYAGIRWQYASSVVESANAYHALQRVAALTTYAISRKGKTGGVLLSVDAAVLVCRMHPYPAAGVYGYILDCGQPLLVVCNYTRCWSTTKV